MKISLKLLPMSVIIFSLMGCNEKKTEAKTELKEDISKSETIEILVGTYTNETSKGIYKLAFNPADGTLENKVLVVESTSPSFLIQSKDKQFVFAVNEKDPGKITSFKWNSSRSELEEMNTVESMGSGPCHIELNNKENLLSVANYGSGNIAVYPVNNGKIIDSVQVRQHMGSSIVVPNQKSPHAHCSKFDKQGKFLYVADLGIDQIVSYPMNADGILGEKQTALDLDKGDGPRHFIFHPSKNLAFVVNELSSTVTAVKVNHETGIFEKIDKQSTLPKDYSEKSYCADIHISSNGKFLYASNRGHNSIAVFSVSDEGKLELLQTESVQGDWPRNFTFSPDEKFLLVANQNSDNITVFNINPETGLLAYTGNEIKISKPVCLEF